MSQLTNESSDSPTNKASAILLFIGFLSNLINSIIENYDSIFKVLTIISLTFVCIINVGKVISIAVEKTKQIKNFFTKSK
jgi:hypothetical protein